MSIGNDIVYIILVMIFSFSSQSPSSWYISPPALIFAYPLLPSRGIVTFALCLHLLLISLSPIYFLFYYVFFSPISKSSRHRGVLISLHLPKSILLFKSVSKVSPTLARCPTIHKLFLVAQTSQSVLDSPLKCIPTLP